MTDGEDPLVSATVIVGRQEGGTPRAGGPPSAGGDPAVPEFFAAAGFEVGAVVAGSFSITAPRSLFESTFGEPLEEKRRGGGRSYRTARGTLELDLARMPERVSRHVEAVAFSRPPDFGPTSFG